MGTLTDSGATELVAAGFSFLEGARWHDSQLYVSDYYTCRVLTIQRSGRVELVCEVPNQPSGLGFAPDGTLLISSMLDRRILAFADGVLEERGDVGALVGGPINDMLVDRLGRCYVGNFGSDVHLGEAARPAALVRVDPDGSAEIVADELLFPNGMAITPDGATLLVAETLGSRILAFDVEPDGALKGRRVWAQLSEPGPADFGAAIEAGAVLPDGICLAADGRLWVADAAGGGAILVEEGGTVARRVPTGDYTAYAVALGGGDAETLFICAGAALGSIDPGVTHLSALLAGPADQDPDRSPGKA